MNAANSEVLYHVLLHVVSLAVGLRLKVITHYTLCCRLLSSHLCGASFVLLCVEHWQVVDMLSTGTIQLFQ